MDTKSSINDDYECIGGEGWYYERCSSNFIVNVARRLFSDTPPLSAPFREDCSLHLGNEKKIRLPENERKEYYSSIENFMLRASSGILKQRNDNKYELSSFQELSMIVHTSSSYEEVFIRRNAVLLFMQRILRSAQLHRASLKPTYPGSTTFCTCGELPHCEFCPLHDIYDSERYFLYPPLEPGDRVKRGPDWQWSNQDGNGEGSVLERKSWKGEKDKAISVRWDNGNENIYRYGGEMCYDVIEANPAIRHDFVPLGGYEECSETFWSRYVSHYLSKKKNRDDLLKLLPDYEKDDSIDRSVPFYFTMIATFASHSLSILYPLLNQLETEIMSFFNDQHHECSFQPSIHYFSLIHDILFPFQIYLLSQAQDDNTCQRTESMILEGYVIEVLHITLRLLSKAISIITQHPSRQPIIITSLYSSVLGELLPYLLNALYQGDYSYHIISSLQHDLEDITNSCCTLLKLCNIHKLPSQGCEDNLTTCLYSSELTTIPQPLPWYSTLFNLLVITNTKYHYSCIYFTYIESDYDVRCLLESYCFSGGLIQDNEPKTSLYRQLRRVYENDENYDSIYSWLNQNNSEPAWKRSRSASHMFFEVKLFISIVYLCGYSDVFMDCLGSIHDPGFPIPDCLLPLWRIVLKAREELRRKKQELVNLTYRSQNHTLTKKMSSNALIRYDSHQYLSINRENSERHLPPSPNNRKVIERMKTNTLGSDVYLEGKSSEKAIEKNVSYTRYEDFVGYLIEKTELLMELHEPRNYNEEKNEESQKEEPKGNDISNIPENRAELICKCIYKFFFVHTTISMDYLRQCLQKRSENVENKKRIFEDGLKFIQNISVFPQSCRLFLLDVFYEMTQYSKLCIGGYHDERRRNERAFSIDYLENCEGGSCLSIDSSIVSLKQFVLYLMKLFRQCVANLEWRLGCTIIWFISTVSSPKLPYFAYEIDLQSFLQKNYMQLANDYMMNNDYSKDILISPGVFWDSLCQTFIPLSASHFHSMLDRILKKSSFQHQQNLHVPGIFPIPVLALGNAMRLAYSILLIQQFSDYYSRSVLSPAQNGNSLFNWTLTDVSNLFIRRSKKYVEVTKSTFDQLMHYFNTMQRVLQERCDSWQPFAPISYQDINTTRNPYSCIKRFDEKNIMRGMIATDMLISAAEGTIASYLALLVFIIKTRLSSVLQWKKYANTIWTMLYFSPRHQKLATMLLQTIIPVYSYIPPVFDKERVEYIDIAEGTTETDSILRNPLLYPPHYPQNEGMTLEKRKAFVYYLLHLASHSDGCPGALVGERNSCSLCCNFFPLIYNLMCKSSTLYGIPNKESFLEEIVLTKQKVFVSSCHMHIRPDGHTASFCSLVFAEEMVYLLREMMNVEDWLNPIMLVFSEIFDYTKQQILQEKQSDYNHGFHAVLRKRSPWFCMITAVLKVLGAITPRMYAGCRIRIHDYLMEGENDVNTLIHTAYQSHGTGSIIKYHRSMGEALVLLDKIDTPLYINSYVFDVVDRVAPPKDTKQKYESFLKSILSIMQQLSLSDAAFALPSEDMPFFNTEDLSIPPYLLQNHILHIFCVRCINHIIISNETLLSCIGSGDIKYLLSIATRPLPCRTSFNTLIIRQYFNWFIEYICDTYNNAARLLPMELQADDGNDVIQKKDKADLRFGYPKDDESVIVEDEEETPAIIRNEKRLIVAKELSQLSSISVPVVYTLLQTMNDNEDDVVSYLMEQPKDLICSNYSLSPDIINRDGKYDDRSILSDMELGIMNPLIKRKNMNHVDDDLLVTVIPAFTNLQRITKENLSNLNSIIGVIASVTDKRTLYSPIPLTGVITAVNSSSVTLSMLNVNSGLLEEHVYPANKVSLHKNRLLFYLSNVGLLRGVTARICCVLSMKYIRELLICLLYYGDHLHKDVLTSWEIGPSSLLHLIKTTYIAYTNSLVLNPYKQKYITMVHCLYRILRGTIKNMIKTSAKGGELFDALVKDIWSLSSPSTHRHQASFNLQHDEISQDYYVNSMHPSFLKCKYFDRITIPGIAGFRVVFDSRCSLDANHSALSFFRDDLHSEIIARFTGESTNFCSFTMRGTTLHYCFESDSKAQLCWGFAFYIQPFKNISWKGDMEITKGACFDWNCYALEFALDVVREISLPDQNIFVSLLHYLIDYVRTQGMPYKSKIIELLISLINTVPIEEKDKPDIEGVIQIIIEYCEHLDIHSIVPHHIPIIIEFIITYTSHSLLSQLSNVDSVDDPIPVFVERMDPIQDDLRTTITTVYVLSRCFYYHSLLPPAYFRKIAQFFNQEWKPEVFVRLVTLFRRFDRVIDDQLIQSYNQFCSSRHFFMHDNHVLDYTCDEDDRARYYGLSSFTNKELQTRLLLIHYFNMQLQRVVHLVELGNNGRETNQYTLGHYFSLITGYIFPEVKEDFLELSINQTVYHGTDAHPIVELDNRRVFTELERSELQLSTFVDEEGKNAAVSQCTFAQLYRDMKKYSVDVLRAPLDGRDRLLAVRFKGEQGLDWGGLYRDAIERCIEDLFSDRIDLFIPSPNYRRNPEQSEEKYIVNPKYRESNDALAMYTFVGNLIGVSLRTKHMLDFELNSAIWKAIVGDNVTMEDISRIDSEFVATMKEIKEYSSEDGNDEFICCFELTFCVEDSAGTAIELIPSGSQIPVTFENRLKYVDLASEFRLNECKQVIEAIAAGVYAIVPQRALSLFTWEQLERAVRGLPDISIAVLKKHTVYFGWSEQHDVVQRFWRVMETLSNKDKSQLLRFTWGKSHLPKGDVWSRPFKLCYSENGDDMLPTAHTCFFQLDLPQYSSDQIMKERLLIAIQFGSGEFMLRYCICSISLVSIE